MKCDGPVVADPEILKCDDVAVENNTPSKIERVSQSLPIRRLHALECIFGHTMSSNQDMEMVYVAREIDLLQGQITIKRSVARDRAECMDFLSAFRLIADAERSTKLLRRWKLYLANKTKNTLPLKRKRSTSEESDDSISSQLLTCKRMSVSEDPLSPGKRRRGSSTDCESPASEPEPSPTNSMAIKKRVQFADLPQVVGVADSNYDREAVCPSQPTLIEDVILRAFGTYPDKVLDSLPSHLFEGGADDASPSADLLCYSPGYEETSS